MQSAGNSTFNYVNPVRRDVVNAGVIGQQMVIRWVTDNSGPWLLHWYGIIFIDLSGKVLTLDQVTLTGTSMRTFMNVLTKGNR